MKVLVTGGTGFVGRHFIAFLKKQGVEVISIERLPKRHTGSNIIYHDLCAEIPERIISKLQDIEYVVHLAARVSFETDKDHEMFHQNSTATLNVLEMARQLPRLKKLIYLSSADVLGGARENEPHIEASPLRPQNMYAASKACGEILVQSYFRTFKVPGIIVRTRNIYGTDCRENTFLATLIRAMKAGEKVTPHVSSTGRSGVRNWVYIETLCHLLRDLFSAPAGEVYHVPGYAIPNDWIIRTVANILGVTPNVVPTVVPDDQLYYIIRDTKLGYLFEEPHFTETVRALARMGQCASS